MSEIDALQQRLTAAMDRIASGLDGLGASAGDETAALQTALDDEKIANAQLTERVKKMGERQDSALAAAQAATDAAQSRVAEMDLILQQLRHSNDQLRASNAALRAANADGLADPDVINTSMMAELDALRASRAADVAEAYSIIDALTPLLEADEHSEENANA